MPPICFLSKLNFIPLLACSSVQHNNRPGLCFHCVPAKARVMFALLCIIWAVMASRPATVRTSHRRVSFHILITFLDCQVLNICPHPIYLYALKIFFLTCDQDAMKQTRPCSQQLTFPACHQDKGRDWVI